MSIPTQGEEFAKLIEYLRKAQECAAMLAHLANGDGDARGRNIAIGWLMVEQQFKMTQHAVTALAAGKLQ